MKLCKRTPKKVGRECAGRCKKSAKELPRQSGVTEVVLLKETGKQRSVTVRRNGTGSVPGEYLKVNASTRQVNADAERLSGRKMYQVICEKRVTATNELRGTGIHTLYSKT